MLSGCDQNIGRNMDGGHSDEFSDRNKELVVGNWQKGNPYYNK